MKLWDHAEVTYSQAAIFHERCYAVYFRGELQGYVSKRPSRLWGYRVIDRDPAGQMIEKPWTVPYETRALAADHLISANRPSAAWLK